MRISLSVRLLPVCFAALFLQGCVAYKYSSTWFVRNSSATATISVSTVDPDKGGDPRNFELAPGEMRAIYSERTVCAENFVPANNYSPGDILPLSELLPKLEFRIGGKQLSPDIRTSENWDYFASEYIEKYTLVIDDAMIGEYGTE